MWGLTLVAWEELVWFWGSETRRAQGDGWLYTMASLLRAQEDRHAQDRHSHPLQGTGTRAGGLSSRSGEKASYPKPLCFLFPTRPVPATENRRDTPGVCQSQTKGAGDGQKATCL